MGAPERAMSEPWFESSDTRTVLRSYKRAISEAWVAHLRWVRIMRFFKRLFYRGGIHERATESLKDKSGVDRYWSW
jgi:hypothetical protein